jgi:large conductance mechanosensitive channel
MHYGVFIQNVFDFVIVAFAIFMAIKLINNSTVKRRAGSSASTNERRSLLSEIRDLLKEQNNRV